MLLFPNPLPRERELTILLDSGISSSPIVQLIDYEGIELFRSAIPIEQGARQIRVKLSGIPRGSYRLRLECGDQIGEQRLLIF